MTRLAYSKASLSKINTQLKRYQKYLPSLDLKRQQLAVKRKQAQRVWEQSAVDIERYYAQIAAMLPMLAETSLNLDGLVTVKSWVIENENIVGVQLPVLKELNIEVQAYSLFSKPHWVDELVIQLKKMMRLEVQHHLNQQRIEALDSAVKKVTQRVNLFDKVLIPQAQTDIRKIRIYLSDREIAGVVRSKNTKQKRLKMRNR